MVLQHLSMLLVCFLLVCLAHGFDRSLSPKNRTVVPPTVDSTSIKNVLAESLSKDPNAFAKVFAQIDPSLYHGQILGLEAILDELKDEKKSYEDEKVSADKANATAHDNLEVANNDLDTAQANFNAAEQIQDDAANEAIIAHTKAQIATEAFEKHTPVLENEIEVVEGVIADLYGLLASFYIELRRPISAGIGNNLHHLHIYEIEAFDNNNNKCQLVYTDASHLVKLGHKKTDTWYLTPEACIDGDYDTLNHNDFSSPSDYGTEDHWMEFACMCNSISKIRIYNRHVPQRILNSVLTLMDSNREVLSQHTITTVGTGDLGMIEWDVNYEA